uniref:DUF7887 domain-containing protein n=1 Tax=Kalanchoe fedtschenkoi TaxID=63787 RepID=A0A7N1A981_KALFE
MVGIQQSISISNLILPPSSYPHVNHNNGRRHRSFILAKREDPAAKRVPEKIDPKFPINKALAQVGISVLALGFIDAGYSGDWSRIGVISKDTEDLLKAAAFAVLPLSLYLIYKISSKETDAK